LIRKEKSAGSALSRGLRAGFFGVKSQSQDTSDAAAHRHFLPGHVWHITHLNSSQFQSFQWSIALGPFITGISPFEPF
jgi:hypothetical protein